VPKRGSAVFLGVLFDDVHAEQNAFVADEDAIWATNELVELVLALLAIRTMTVRVGWIDRTRL